MAFVTNFCQLSQQRNIDTLLNILIVCFYVFFSGMLNISGQVSVAWKLFYVPDKKKLKWMKISE